MMGNNEKKRRFSINRKLYIVISLLVFGTTLISLLILSRRYVIRATESFGKITEQIAEANKDAFLSYDLIECSEFLLSDETSEARKKAIRDGNEYEYIDYLVEKDMWEFQCQAWVHLKQVEETYEVSDVLIAACHDGACYYVTSGMNNMVQEGKKLPFDAHDLVTDNQDMAAHTRVREDDPQGEEYVVFKDSPYFAASSEILRYEGWTIYMVCTNSYEKLFAELSRFFGSMLVLFILLSTVSAIIGVLILKKQITSPIISLKQNAQMFALENTVNHSAPPVKLNIHSNDELEDLGISLYELESSVVRTQEELRKISEEKGRMAAQLSIARDIQFGVLPTDFSKQNDYEIYALMEPAREVGGDLYDFFMPDDTHLVLVIGDVSDKGIPAALFMMTAKTLLRAHAMMDPDPAAILHDVNNRLCEINPHEMFVTVWVGILDLVSGVMTCANGGHEYPMFSVGNGFEVYRDPHGMALGCMENRSYQNYEVKLKEGDRIFVYSDGATDAINTENKAIGLEGLTDLVRESEKLHELPDAFVKWIYEKLTEYSGEMDQFDDITMLAMNYHPSKNG